jgi:hypothetical protein
VGRIDDLLWVLFGYFHALISEGMILRGRTPRKSPLEKGGLFPLIFAVVLTSEGR